jgi:hypothetical protein
MIGISQHFSPVGRQSQKISGDQEDTVNGQTAKRI